LTFNQQAAKNRRNPPESRKMRRGFSLVREKEGADVKNAHR